MGLWQRLLGGAPHDGNRSPRTLTYTLAETRSPREALMELAKRLESLGRDDGWITVTVTGCGMGPRGAPIAIQATAAQVNTLLHELPPGLVADLELRRLDAGLYQLADPSPERLAAVMDSVLAVGFGCGDRYGFVGVIES